MPATTARVQKPVLAPCNVASSVASGRPRDISCFEGRLVKEGRLRSMRRWIRASALSLGVAAALAPRDAHALGPLDVEVALRGGGGTPPGGDSPSPLAYGIGGRAGVAIFGWYGGLSLVDYFGESQTALSPGFSGSTTTSVHALLFGVEGGYGLKFGPTTVRAQVGVGNYQETVAFQAASGGCVSVVIGQACTPAGPVRPSYTVSSLYLEPGVTAMIAFGTVFGAADANVLVLPHEPGTSSVGAAFTLHGQVGLKF
jgi:hypothetical protein